MSNVPETIHYDHVGDAAVSTIRMPHGSGHDYETVVFRGPLNGKGSRYASRVQADYGHGEWLTRVREAARNLATS